VPPVPAAPAARAAAPANARGPPAGSAGAPAVSAPAAGVLGGPRAPPARWWQDPEQVFGAEVLTGTLAQLQQTQGVPAPGATVGGYGQRTEATSRPDCGCAPRHAGTKPLETPWLLPVRCL